MDVIASYTRNGLAGPQVVQTGSNPFTASLGPLLDRLNTLSTSAGLDPVVLSAGSSTPGAPHRRLRPVSQ